MTPRCPRFVVGCAAIALALAAAPSAHANIVLGFQEHFPGPAISGWSSQAINANPGPGGVPGKPGGWLSITTPNGTIHNLGSVAITTDYLGSFPAAGVTQIRLWLNDINTAQPLEMHVSVGNATNLWQY